MLRRALLQTTAVLGLLTVLLLCFGVTPSEALYFYLTQGTPRCFVEEVPEETLVVVYYNNMDYQEGWRVEDRDPVGDGKLGIQLYAEDPITKQQVARTWATHSGKFAFTSSNGGEHKICVVAIGAAWFGSELKHKFSLHVDVGEAAMDYEDLAKQEHLSAIEVEIRKLNDKVRSVRSEQIYQKVREETFRDTSESTNSRVMWWSLMQTIFLICSGLYQIRHLQTFFKKKKLV